MEYWYMQRLRATQRDPVGLARVEAKVEFEKRRGIADLIQDLELSQGNASESTEMECTLWLLASSLSLFFYVAALLFLSHALAKRRPDWVGTVERIGTYEHGQRIYYLPLPSSVLKHLTHAR
jgi:hypothetical protein